MPKEIVIVGGGTAGWMAAIAISAHLPSAKITVLDPTVVAPIGVGESVTGVVMHFVRYPPHGLDRTEFFRESDATLKLGIRFQDWLGAGRDYLAPIDFPPDIFDHAYPEDMENFYALFTAAGKSIGEEQIHGKLIRALKTDYHRQGAVVSGQWSSASCQFDALKFAAWLKKKCQQRPSIRHVDDTMASFQQDPESGFVTKVITQQGLEIEGDFFLDCTGFHRLLFEKAYSPPWTDYSAHIKVDRAIPSFHAHDPNEPIPVHTLARAMPHGWMWGIPTQSRMGRGYVYSSKYVSDEQAKEEQRAIGIDPGESPRIIRFTPGKFQSQWEGNVCAIGLAGGIIEPLESTTIHIMDVQIKVLTELLLPHFSKSSAKPLAAKFNKIIGTMYDDFVDFVSFHYHTGRDDTDFWRDYQRETAITEKNLARMEMWKHAYPGREDFAGVITSRFVQTTGIIVWMPMLCGMGLLNRDAARRSLDHAKFVNWAHTNMNKYCQLRDYLCQYGVSQREAIQTLRGETPPPQPLGPFGSIDVGM